MTQAHQGEGELQQGKVREHQAAQVSAGEGKSHLGSVKAFQDDLSSWVGKLRVPAPIREDSKERRNAR